MLGSSIG